MDNRTLVAAARGARLQYWHGYLETWRMFLLMLAEELSYEVLE